MSKKYYDRKKSYGGVTGRERYNTISDFAKDDLKKKLSTMSEILSSIDKSNPNNQDLKNQINEMRCELLSFKKDLESIGVLVGPCAKRVVRKDYRAVDFVETKDF